MSSTQMDPFGKLLLMTQSLINVTWTGPTTRVCSLPGDLQSSPDVTVSNPGVLQGTVLAPARYPGAIISS